MNSIIISCFIVVSLHLVKSQELTSFGVLLTKTFLNRGCPNLDCPYISCPSRCKMPTLYRYNGLLCRGCHINICSSYIHPVSTGIQELNV